MLDNPTYPVYITLAFLRLDPINFLFRQSEELNYSCSLEDKHRISRDSIVLGRILGEGFFGEVNEGVYKSKVSSSSF